MAAILYERCDGRQRDRRGLTALGPVSTFLPLRAPCPGGGIGRRAGFRCQWGNTRGGSSPLLGTTVIYHPSEIDFGEHLFAISNNKSLPEPLSDGGLSTFFLIERDSLP